MALGNLLKPYPAGIANAMVMIPTNVAVSRLFMNGSINAVPCNAVIRLFSVSDTGNSEGNLAKTVYFGKLNASNTKM
jgi:hypothetical protein